MSTDTQTKTFAVGDRVTMQQHTGTVVAIVKFQADSVDVKFDGGRRAVVQAKFLVKTAA